MDYSAPFHLAQTKKNKLGLISFSYCECGTIAQTGDYVTFECHMHWALHGARGRTVLDKIKQWWLGTLLTASVPDNTSQFVVKIKPKGPTLVYVFYLE